MSILKRLFKRKEIDVEKYNFPNVYDELTEMICDFVEKNNNDDFFTHIILTNGKSVLVSHEQNIHMCPNGFFISIRDKKDIEVVLINLKDISVLVRVPKGAINELRVNKNKQEILEY